jgi:hypothetical protein
LPAGEFLIHTLMLPFPPNRVHRWVADDLRNRNPLGFHPDNHQHDGSHTPTKFEERAQP